MSDHTPTTEEVKANYALVGDDEVVNKINEQKFDRWLEQNNAEVAKSTEQRIIKLLHQELADGFAKAFVIGLIIGEPFPHVRAEIGHLSPETSIKRADSACPCGCKDSND